MPGPGERSAPPTYAHSTGKVRGLLRHWGPNIGTLRLYEAVGEAAAFRFWT